MSTFDVILMWQYKIRWDNVICDYIMQYILVQCDIGKTWYVSIYSNASPYNMMEDDIIYNIISWYDIRWNIYVEIYVEIAFIVYIMI